MLKLFDTKKTDIKGQFFFNVVKKSKKLTESVRSFLFKQQARYHDTHQTF